MDIADSQINPNLSLLVSKQVIHHTARLERRLLENSLSTNKLEKQLIVQTNEINKLKDKTRYEALLSLT